MPGACAPPSVRILRSTCKSMLASVDWVGGLIVHNVRCNLEDTPRSVATVW